MDHRIARNTLAAIAMVSTLATGAIAAGTPAAGNLVVIKDVAFRGTGGSTVKLVKAAGADAVAVDGATAVIGFQKILEKAAGKAALSSCTFTLRAVDDKEHRYSFAFGKLATVNVTEGDGVAWLLPAFNGAKTYSVQIFDKGKLVKSLAGQTTKITLEGWPPHAGELESLSFDLTFAKEQKDAWSVTLSHGDEVIVLTPEGVQKTLADAPAEISVQSTGVEAGFVLIRQGVTVSPI
jgi:hypothetical protein